MSELSEPTNNWRDSHGRFLPGNPDGPGRPPRAIERDYLSIAGNTITMEDWKALVEMTLDRAKAGDAKAREWITRICIGTKPPTLKELATKEVRGVSSTEEIEVEKEREEQFERSVKEYNSLINRVRGLYPDAQASDNGGPSDDRDGERPEPNGNGQEGDGHRFSTD